MTIADHIGRRLYGGSGWYFNWPLVIALLANAAVWAAAYLLLREVL